MIEVNFGDRVEASCTFDYSGPAGYFTFALEIGTLFPLGVFNTLDRWETKKIYVTPGNRQTRRMVFIVSEADGLNRGDIYDMNWEIGTGSQDDGTWDLKKRIFTDDIIKIAAVAPEFSNLSVSYKKV